MHLWLRRGNPFRRLDELRETINREAAEEAEKTNACWSKDLHTAVSVVTHAFLRFKACALGRALGRGRRCCEQREESLRKAQISLIRSGDEFAFGEFLDRHRTVVEKVRGEQQQGLN